MTNIVGQIGTSQAGRGMSAYGALGQLIEMYIVCKWQGFGISDTDLDGVPAIVTDSFAEGMTVKVPGAEKELEKLERDIRRLNEKYYRRLMHLAENTCFVCGEDRAGRARYCACCAERMVGTG